MHPPGLLRLGDGLVAEMGGGLVGLGLGGHPGGLSVVAAAPYKAGRAQRNRGGGESLPELPEVETVRRGLEPVLAGPRHRARRGPPARPALAVPAAARRAADRPPGRPALRRRSKYLLADLDGGETLILHLGMSGRLLVSGRAGRRLPSPAPGAGEARPRGARRRGRRAGHLQRRPPLRRPRPLADARARGAPAPRRARPRAARQRLRRRLPRRAPDRPPDARSRRCSATSGWSRASATSTSAEALWRARISPLRLARDVTAGRGRDAGRGGPRRPRRRHRRRRLVACATTARPTASSATSSIPSPSTTARASPARAAAGRSCGRCSRAGRASGARLARPDAGW